MSVGGYLREVGIEWPDKPAKERLSYYVWMIRSSELLAAEVLCWDSKRGEKCKCCRTYMEM